MVAGQSNMGDNGPGGTLIAVNGHNPMPELGEKSTRGWGVQQAFPARTFMSSFKLSSPTSRQVLGIGLCAAVFLGLVDVGRAQTTRLTGFVDPFIGTEPSPGSQLSASRLIRAMSFPVRSRRVACWPGVPTRRTPTNRRRLLVSRPVHRRLQPHAFQRSRRHLLEGHPVHAHDSAGHGFAGRGLRPGSPRPSRTRTKASPRAFTVSG